MHLTIQAPVRLARNWQTATESVRPLQRVWKTTEARELTSEQSTGSADLVTKA